MKRLMLLSAIALAACGSEPKADAPPVATAPAVSPDVTLVLGVAAGIQAAPTMADSVLQAHGLTRAGFDSLLYTIAADSVLSAQYSAGRR